MLCVSPCVFLPVVVPSDQVGMVDLLSLRRPHKDAGLAGLFGQAVVDIGDDGEVGALWVAEANIDPVISDTHNKRVTKLMI